MKDTILTENTIVLRDTLTQITHEINLNEVSGDNSQLVSNSITILLALIAAFLALYQVKSNIISSSRITWIENLRNSISNYVAEVNNCATILNNLQDKYIEVDKNEKEAIFDEFYPSYMESSREIDKLGNKVLLYLNSDETNHKKIENIIYRIDRQLNKGEMVFSNKEKIEKDALDIVITAKLIFKTEWNKSKRVFKI